MRLNDLQQTLYSTFLLVIVCCFPGECGDKQRAIMVFKNNHQAFTNTTIQVIINIITLVTKGVFLIIAHHLYLLLRTIQ